MRLSLIFPSWFTEMGDFKSAARRVSTFPPLNLCLIGALAKQAGWEVDLIDAHIEGLDDQALLARVARFSPDLIGLTAATPFYPQALRQARLFKKELGRPVMMGGPHVTYYKEKAFDPGLDYLVVGECDLTFPDFLRQLAQGDRCPDVPGIVMRRDGQVFYKGPAPILTDLDQAPPADRSLLKNELYTLGTPQGLKRYTSVQMSRGCPFSCVFCASDLYGRQVRFRGIPQVIRELKSVIHDYGAEHVYFVDDVLTLNRRYVISLCEAIQQEKLAFTFEGSSRANLWDEDIAARLKACGLLRISFGLESADERVRQIIRKEVPLDSYVQANQINNRLGIETTNSVIIGLPGDTRQSIETTVRYLCAHREIQHVTLNVAIPYPGTEMLKMAERGEHGLKLVEQDFAKFQRYGSAVMEVNGLSTQELVRLQRLALWRIYLCWWRWVPVWKRFGFKTLLETGWNLVRSLVQARVASSAGGKDPV